jgi:autotransporter-associated beta strand protein
MMEYKTEGPNFLATRRRAGSALTPVSVARTGLLLVLLFGASTARAVVIVGGDGSGNTMAPSDDPGWANVGFMDGASCVYLGNGWVITASHVGLNPATYNNVSYADVPSSYVRLVEPSNPSQVVDLCMFQLQTNPAGLGPVTVSSSEPPSGSQITAIGYGASRATNETYWDGNWNVVSSPTDAVYAGYYWASGGTERWGTANISQYFGTSVDDGFGVTDCWETMFDPGGGPNAMQAAGGDSGGGVFYKSSTGWQLAGIMLAIGLFENQPWGTAAFGNTTYFADLSQYAGEISQIMAAPQPLYWSGSGTWDQGTTANWSRVSGGPYPLTWTGGNAVFEGTAGTVTVASTGVSSVNSITFTTDGYTLAGTGAITLTGAGGNITTGAGTDTINCTIAGSVGLTKLGSGTLVLGAANTFTGLTQITGGTLQLAHSNALQNSTLDYNNYGGVLSFGSLTSATFGGLQGAQSLSLTSTGGNVALTVGSNNASTTYSGQLSGGGSLAKVGAGRLILTGPNSYTGLTTVMAGGAIELGVNAQTNVLANGADIQNSATAVGALVFDYSGSDATLLASIRTDLQNGVIKDSLAGTAIPGGGQVTLGYLDNGSSVTVEAMLAGDANHDGTVNVSDLATLGLNWKKTNQTWAQGDFNYDGTVNASDLATLGLNWKQTWSPSFPSDVVGVGGLPAFSGTAVPEPGSLVMLASVGTAALGMLAYAWRKRRRTA